MNIVSSAKNLEVIFDKNFNFKDRYLIGKKGGSFRWHFILIGA